MKYSIFVSTFREAIVEAGRRILKVDLFAGAKTADEVAPFGDDSSPLPELTAIYAKSSEIGDNFIIGYINTQQLAELGEKRIYSLRSNGALSFAVHLKNDGTCEIGGSGNFFVKFNELETAFNQLKSDFDALVTTYNAHTHTTTATVGSTPAVGVIAATTSQGSQSTADISPAKAENIKTA